MIDRNKPRVGTTKDLLDISQMDGEFVQIMTKSMMIDPESGRQMNHSQTAFLRGCDGMFIYYSFGQDGPFSGFIPITEIMNVVRVDHIEEMIKDDDT